MNSHASQSGRWIFYILNSSRFRPLTCSVLESGSPWNATIKKTNLFEFRIDLNSVRHSRLTSEDKRILDRLRKSQRTYASEILLEGPQAYDLIRTLVATGRCFWESPLGPPMKWGETRKARPDWKVEEGEYLQPIVHLSPECHRLLHLSSPIYVDTEARLFGDVDSPVSKDLLFAWATAPRMPFTQAEQFHANLIKRFPRDHIPELRLPEVREIEGAKPVPVLELSGQQHDWARSSQEGVTRPVGKVKLEYEGVQIDPGSSQPFVNSFQDGVIHKLKRNPEQEKAALAQLQPMGFEPMEPEAPNPDRPQGPPVDLEDYWRFPANGGGWQTAMENLQNNGWRITTEQNLEVRPLEETNWYSDLESSEWNWFEFELGIEIDGHRVNLLPFLCDLLQQWRHLPLNEIKQQVYHRPLTVPVSQTQACLLSGQRLETILDKLFELFDQEPLSKKGRLALDDFRVAELVELEELAPEPWDTSPRVRRLVNMLREGIELSPCEPPPGLGTELRPYQKKGLAWMQILRAYEMDGILADDMGLGKTVQTLAHLLMEKHGGRLRHPCLIVAPTSLMKNWLDEAKRFVPDFNVVVLHGLDRARYFKRAKAADLILTTYPLLRQDADWHLKQQFSYVVLDEAQFVKNTKSQTAQRVYELQAERRLCLTGTPLENHLGELWSLFHFLMPGFLGDDKSFKARFRDPIEKLGLGDRQQFLSRRISPFLLRRTKDEVETDLPPKTEMVHSISLTEVQRDRYETVRLAMDARIRKEIKRKGLKRSQIIILDALLKLRQICCDPRLMDKDKTNSAPADSAKLEALMELVPELIKEQRRILLFSQFTSMLALIERELHHRKIPYVKLTGSTKDRATPIAKFQEGRVPLFLISLKAGGTGLNLTAADTVIHYDPWWNPAVENQATDRAHRIGQDKPVFVYKLITEGTVETKIQKMQEKKSRLAEGILSGSFKDKLAFSQEDLDVLFEPLDGQP